MMARNDQSLELDGPHQLQIFADDVPLLAENNCHKKKIHKIPVTQLVWNSEN
jgi:hypothetical protein